MNKKVNEEFVRIASLVKDEWITVDQMRSICASCADKMVQNNISKVRAAVIVENIRQAYGWESLPKGWTKESVKKFWKSLTGERVHKVTACIKKLAPHLGEDRAAPMCASLADMMTPGWRSER